MAISIFSIIEGLTVSRDDVLEAELFAEQYLSAQFPDYDFRQGTALRDMTIRPNATLLALVNKAIQFYFDDSDVINMTNSTDKDLVDRKLSNFFITRKAGTDAVINARLFFSFPLNEPVSVLIPAGAYFSADNVTRFYPRTNITVLEPAAVEDPTRTYFKYDGSSQQWYCDIELVSASSTLEANIESGDLLYFTIFSPYFLRAEIQYLKERAVEEETNEQMVSRAYTSVSTRNLINKPSITSRISDEFNYVDTIYPVGLGDDWLYRDIIAIEDVSSPGTFRDYHRGGHVDIYIETAPSTDVVQLTAEQDRDTPSDVAFYIEGPVYGVTRSDNAPPDRDQDTLPYYRDPAVPSLGTLPFDYSMANVSTYDAGSVPASPESDLGISSRQLTKIKFVDTVTIGQTASFNLSRFSGVQSVETQINGDAESVVCADYLIRGFEPVFIDIEVEVRNGIPTDQTITESALREYIEGIPNGGSIYVSELVNTIIDSGVSDFRMPLTVNAVRHPRDSAGNQDGPSNAVTTSLVDTMELLPIRKFYLRNITYTEV